MTQEAVEQAQTETQQEVKPDVQLTTEQQMDTVKKTARMRHKALSQLTRVHLADLINDLAFKPGVSGNDKVAMINTILDSFEGVLDLGLGITKVQVPETGKYARRTVQLAGILAQALDNRMLLLAVNEEEKSQNVSAGGTTVVEENNEQGENNAIA